MVDFYDIVDKIENNNGYTLNPYAGKKNGKWLEGSANIDFLNENFGEYETATEMKENTDSEGLKKFFDYLADEGKILE